MTDKELYAVPIPSGAQSRLDRSTRQQQSRQTLLNEDSGDVAGLGSEPGDRTLVVEYADEYASVRAAEVRELATSFSQPLPLHVQTGTSVDDRYVVAQRGEVAPVDPRSETFQRATLLLSDAGTRASHWRRVRTAPAQVDHSFGNATKAPVGVPAAAEKVRWYNPTSGAREVPTVQSTRTSRLGDVDILHARNSSYDDPHLLFNIAYAEEGKTDPRVWDDRGQASITSSGAVVWQKVFSTDHVFDDQAVLENGLLRLFVDESGNSLTAEEWDTGTSSWSSLSLGTSDWEIYDLDLRTIGLAQVGGIMEFRDTTQSPTAFHRLGFQLQRGAEDILFSTATPIPSGLDSLLTPIAADHIYDPYGDLTAAPSGLLARSEVGL